MSARLVDVAGAAGVSVATASKALNNRRDVSPQTRERVLAAAEALRFEPNPLARDLASAKTRTIGLLVRDSRVQRFAVPVMIGAENALGDTELSVILCDGRGDEIRVRSHLRQLVRRRVDGIIVVGEDTDIRPSLSQHSAVPIVYAYSGSDGADDVSVMPDDRGGARLALEHLVQAGRRRIVHVTGPREAAAAHERAAGVKVVMDEHDLRTVAPVFYGHWSQQWGRQATDMLLTSGVAVDAIACGSDQIATGVADALIAAGRTVPDDVALTGFDNWLEFAEQARPPLTTIDMNLEQLGASAARELLARIDGPPQTHGVLRHPCRLIVRQSSVATSVSLSERPQAAT